MATKASMLATVNRKEPMHRPCDGTDLPFRMAELLRDEVGALALASTADRY
jgi:hypothetical protein